MNRHIFTLGPRQPAGNVLRRALRHGARSAGDVLRHARAHWVVYLPVFAIWGLAFDRIFVDPTPHLPILFNWTPSLPYRVAIVRYGRSVALARGDYIVYAFDGEAQRIYPGLRAQPFFKKIIGVPGDRVTVLGRQVFVNDRCAGVAKATTFDGHPLATIAETVIPPGYYYVQGTHADSFDSRYRESGLVRMDQVIGQVAPLF